MNRHIAIYPGSFDPFTNGHMDIVNRGLQIFETVIIAVASNSEKNSLFSIDERRFLFFAKLRFIRPDVAAPGRAPDGSSFPAH